MGGRGIERSGSARLSRNCRPLQHSPHGKLATRDLLRQRHYHTGMNKTSTGRRLDITWFVSRHPGAIEWARRERLAIGRWVAHLDPQQVGDGDTVIGTLPVNLAAAVCKRGARYFHLSLQVPAAWRGRELTADELQMLGASLVLYHIEPAANKVPLGVA